MIIRKRNVNLHYCGNLNWQEKIWQASLLPVKDTATTTIIRKDMTTFMICYNFWSKIVVQRAVILHHKLFRICFTDMKNWIFVAWGTNYWHFSRQDKVAYHFLSITKLVLPFPRNTENCHDNFLYCQQKVWQPPILPKKDMATFFLSGEVMITFILATNKFGNLDYYRERYDNPTLWLHLQVNNLWS